MFFMDEVTETLQVLTTLFVLALGLIAFMGYGALSKPAVRTLSRGAGMAGVWALAVGADFVTCAHCETQRCVNSVVCSCTSSRDTGPAKLIGRTV
ncbi:MAG: hypothetical protein V7761_13140 [Amylibacter sp.]